jgi:hypothetical protein
MVFWLATFGQPESCPLARATPFTLIGAGRTHGGGQFGHARRWGQITARTRAIIVQIHQKGSRLGTAAVGNDGNLLLLIVEEKLVAQEGIPSKSQLLKYSFIHSSLQTFTILWSPQKYFICKYAK